MNRFKIYPDLKKPHYYLAFIFETREEMYEFSDASCKAQGRRKLRRDYSAICRSWRTLEPPEKRDIIGHVYFYRDFLGAGVVSHEFAHATWHYFDIVLGRKRIRRNEELFCWILGEMNRQFWNKYFRYTSKRVMTNE